MSGVLLLNADRTPLGVLGRRKVVSLWMRGKVGPMSQAAGMSFGLTSGELVIPETVALLAYADIPPASTLRVSNPLLFARDGYRCQYCGRHEADLGPDEILTRDHILSVCRHRGSTYGERYHRANTWENITTACSTCNNFKDDRTPSEAGMRLISDSSPRRPTGIVLRVRGGLSEEQLSLLADYAGEVFVIAQ